MAELSARARMVADFIRVRRQITGARPRRRRIPRQKYPTNVWRAYAAEIIRVVVDPLRPALDALLAELPGLMSEARRERGIFDSAADRQRELLEQIAQRMASAVTLEEIRAMARIFAERTSTWQRVQLNRQVRAALGAEVLGTESGVDVALQHFAEYNASLIKDIPAKMAVGIEHAVTRAVAASTPHAKLAVELEETFASLGRKRARLIARDQTGKLFSNLSQVRQRNLGANSYRWRGTLDRRERPEHVAREGRLFKWSDPPAGGHPGEAILCRCTAEPDFDQILDAL